MKNVFFKAIVDNGQTAHQCMLCQDFISVEAALKEAKTHFCDPNAFVSIRRYTVPAIVNVLHPDQDTGTEVCRYTRQELAA